MRKFLNLLIVTLVISMSSAALMAAEPAGQAGSSPAGVVNINTADAAQLALLPRIGPKAAERIIAYREANGGFKKTTDLMQVKGVGDKTFQILSPYLTVEGKTTLAEKQRGPRKPRASKKSKASSEPADTAQ